MDTSLSFISENINDTNFFFLNFMFLTGSFFACLSVLIYLFYIGGLPRYFLIMVVCLSFKIGHLNLMWNFVYVSGSYELWVSPVDQYLLNYFSNLARLLLSEAPIPTTMSVTIGIPTENRVSVYCKTWAGCFVIPYFKNFVS